MPHKLQPLYNADALDLEDENYDPVIDRFAAEVAFYFDGPPIICRSRAEIAALFKAQTDLKRDRGIIRSSPVVLESHLLAADRKRVCVAWRHDFADGRPVEVLVTSVFYEPTPFGDRITMVDCRQPAQMN